MLSASGRVEHPCSTAADQGWSALPLLRSTSHWPSLARALSLALALCLAPSCLAAKQPNILLILLDDMGYRDVGFVGNKYISTPNIDKIAKSGAVFSQCYASAPNCAPTRACLLTASIRPVTASTPWSMTVTLLANRT